jgi:hypothetical protein
MSELRILYKDKIKGSYHDESVLITSIKYTKVLKNLVVVSLPENPPKSEQASNAASKDPGTLTGSDVYDPEVYKSPASKGSDALKLKPLNIINTSRAYSTMKSEPYQKINIAQPGGSLCLFSRAPSIIRLARHSNGSFYFEGLDSNNLIHSQRLKEILNGIIGKIRELESVNDKGYINSTRLSDYPVLSGYLRPYVNSKVLAKYDDSALANLSEKAKLQIIDKELTLREKRVLII